MIYESYREIARAGIDIAKITSKYLANGTPAAIVPGTAGSQNLIGNYSATAINLDYTPPSNEIHRVHELIVFVADSGTFDTDAYGNGVTLTNGIQIFLRRSGANVFEFTEFYPIKTNAGWFQICSTSAHRAFGSGNEFMTSHVDFADFFGGPLRLNGATADTLRVVLHDNFSGLNIHTFKIRSEKE